MAAQREKITFPNASGQRLAARLDRPAGAPRAFALFAHCFTCSKDIFAAARISRALAERGFAVLRFDFTGLGASEGEFANTNFSSNVGDLVAAADWLRAEHEAPRLLIGHSLGGAAVLAAAHRVPEAVAVATIGAPADPAHVTRLIAGAAAEIEAEGEGRGRDRGAALPDHPAVPGRCRRAVLGGAHRRAQEGAPDLPRAARRRGRHRERGQDLQGRHAPQEFRLAG